MPDPYQPAAPLPVPVETGPVVPSGSVKEILAWVGDDTDRAKLVEKSEHDRANPRKSLLDSLKGLNKR